MTAPDPAGPTDAQAELREEWRPVVGYEGLYEVSGVGRIRSLPRYGTSGGIKRPVINDDGYLTMRLHAGGNGKHVRVNMLVAEAWHGPRLPGQVCRHLDGDKLNNTPANVVWGTRSENGLDVIRHGVHHLANRDTCGNGHPWTERNTYWKRRGDRRPYRECRECRKTYKRAYHDRQRGAA